MNILFHSVYKVNSSKGGTERATITVAENLRTYLGVRNFCLYVIPEDKPKEDCFDEEFKLNRGETDMQILAIL